MASASDRYRSARSLLQRQKNLHGLLNLAMVCFGVWLGSVSSQAAIKGAVIQFGPGFNRQYPREAPQRDVIAIAAGLQHQMALKSSGEVVVWGGDYRLTNVPPTARSGVTAIAAGGLQSIALKEDGTVVGWGFNEWGEALPPAGLSNVVAIAAGLVNSYAVKQDGSVVAWGFTTTWSHRLLPDELKSNIVAVADGSTHKVALKSDGTIFQWDISTTYTNLANVPQEAQSGIVAISAGYGRTAVLKHDGSVISWGDGQTGPLTTPSGASNAVVAIACGYNFGDQSPFHDYILALRQDGTLVSWGSISNPGPGFDGNGRFRAISAGGSSILALYEPRPLEISGPFSQTVAQWQHADLSISYKTDPVFGANTAFQLLVNGVPVDYPSYSYNSRPRMTNAGEQVEYSVIISNDTGSVTSSPPAIVTVVPPSPGATVGISTNISPMNYVPLAAQSGVVAVEAGTIFALALRYDGSVVQWGGGIPFPSASTKSGVTAISAGWGHALALKENGSVVAWGRSPASTNGAIIGPANAQAEFIAVAAGGYHSLALKRDGTVAGWGNNYYDQISIPLEATGIVAIAAGHFHSVAARNDGTVVAWGNNSNGQTSVPEGLSGVKTVAAGATISAALMHNGTVVVWGSNSPILEVPMGLDRVVSISAKGNNFMALRNDGTVVAWGNSISGSGFENVSAIAASADHANLIVLGSALAITARSTSRDMTLLWPSNAVGYMLQSTADLNAPVSWINWPDSPSLNGSQFVVTNQVHHSRQFFRLFKPIN